MVNWGSYTIGPKFGIILPDLTTTPAFERGLTISKRWTAAIARIDDIQQEAVCQMACRASETTRAGRIKRAGFTDENIANDPKQVTLGSTILTASQPANQNAE